MAWNSYLFRSTPKQAHSHLLGSRKRATLAIPSQTVSRVFIFVKLKTRECFRAGRAFSIRDAFFDLFSSAYGTRDMSILQVVLSEGTMFSTCANTKPKTAERDRLMTKSLHGDSPKYSTGKIIEHVISDLGYDRIIHCVNLVLRVMLAGRRKLHSFVPCFA